MVYCGCRWVCMGLGYGFVVCMLWLGFPGFAAVT